MSRRCLGCVEQVTRLTGARETKARAEAVHELAFLAAQHTHHLAPLEHAIPLLLELAAAGKAGLRVAAV
jgi:hypothetical protein